MASLGSIDGFLPLLKTTDMKQRVEAATSLLCYLKDPITSIQSTNIGLVIEALVPYVACNNLKVSQTGMDILIQFTTRMCNDFQGYVETILPPVIVRMDDDRASVREASQNVILNIVEHTNVNPVLIFKKLLPCFNNKNVNVRHDVLCCLARAIDLCGVKKRGIQIEALLPIVVKMIEDPSNVVRDAANAVLVTMYRHTLNNIRIDNQKKYSTTAQSAKLRMQRFNRSKISSEFLSTANAIKRVLDKIKKVSEPLSVGIDETDRQNPSVGEFVRPDTISTNTISTRSETTDPPSTASRGTSKRKIYQLAKPAGAVDEVYFLKAFDDNVDVHLYSVRELEDHMVKIKEIVEDQHVDWEKRVDAMRKLRGLVSAGAANLDEFHAHLRLLEVPFQTAVKDLRSQVVREACVTVAYLSKVLLNKFDHFAECVLQQIMTLIMNTVKIVASSGLVTVRFILQYVHSARLVPTIVSQNTSKSKDIRRAVCEFIGIMVRLWPTYTLKKHVALIKEAIRIGIGDADAETRSYARKAFWGFRQHFREQSDSLLNGLSQTHKKQILSEVPESQVAGLNSSGPLRTGSGRTAGALPRLQVLNTFRRTTAASPRCKSAIDLRAAQTANARAQHTSLSCRKVVSKSESLLCLPITPDTGPRSLETAVQGIGRARVVFKPQPSSRFGSPSSRLTRTDHAGSVMDNSSPFTFRRPRPPYGNTIQSTGAEKQPRPRIATCTNHTRRVVARDILQRSREGQSVLVDTFNLELSEHIGPSIQKSSHKSSCRSLDNRSDHSETSSVCSESSNDSSKRPFNSDPCSTPQRRLYSDINETIANCGSTHWRDRKDGLVNLQAYLQAGNLLQPTDLKQMTDNFMKMFTDGHTKMFNVLLDTLDDLIIAHRTDLNSWLYILLTRLLNKLGGDVLGSVQNKIHKSLDVVRASFPSDVQMSAVLRFICDSTQTPNVRVKTAACNYISKLVAETDPRVVFLPTSQGHEKDAAALAKIIGWIVGANSKPGNELRRATQEAVVALFNLDAHQELFKLSLLPKDYQEMATRLIQECVRRRSDASVVLPIQGGTVTSPLISVGSMTPTIQYATSNCNAMSVTPLPSQNYASHRDTKNSNPDETDHSPKITADVHNYEFGVKKSNQGETTQDSRINQLSLGEDAKTIVHQMDVIKLTNCISTSTDGILTERFNVDGQSATNVSVESETVKKIVDSLKSDEDEPNSRNCLLTDHEKKTALARLVQLVRESSGTALLHNFKSILRILLTQLGSTESEVKVLVLTSLIEMMKKQDLAESFNNYVELLVLKVLQAFKDGTKKKERCIASPVMKVAEMCVATIATFLAPELVIRVLVPLVATDDYHVKLGAIKTLIKLIETRGPELVQSYLPELMPGLIRAYDNNESSVRKSAVFCLVALHATVGAEPLQPHLSSLNSSKLKLLRLYITRAQQGSSDTNPLNRPSSS